jgi:hypothetical protein
VGPVVKSRLFSHPARDIQVATSEHNALHAVSPREADFESDGRSSDCNVVGVSSARDGDFLPHPLGISPEGRGEGDARAMIPRCRIRRRAFSAFSPGIFYAYSVKAPRARALALSAILIRSDIGRRMGEALLVLPRR